MKNKVGDTHLPRELLLLRMPLQYLPKHHRTRKHIYLMVILWVRMPQFRRLPIHSAHKASHHRPRRLLDFCEPEIGDLGGDAGGDENIGGLAVAVDDGGFVVVQVLKTAGDV